MLSKAGDTRTDAQFANQSEGNSNNNYAGMTGMILEECQKDFAMNELYPGLVHTIALYDNVIYFNLANAIYTLDLSDGSVDQLKEYNDVYAASDVNHNFKGASYYSVAADSENIDLHVKTVLLHHSQSVMMLYSLPFMTVMKDSTSLQVTMFQ